MAVLFFSFYDRGRVVLAAVSADSAGGLLGQSSTGGEPASRQVASSATKSNTGNQPVVQVLVASSATQSNTGGEPASYKCCNSLRTAAARNTEKKK